MILIKIFVSKLLTNLQNVIYSNYDTESDIRIKIR